MSSSSSGGSSVMICSAVIASASIPRTVATGIRNPRMHATPPIWWGFTVMRPMEQMLRDALGLNVSGFGRTFLAIDGLLGVPGSAP